MLQANTLISSLSERVTIEKAIQTKTAKGKPGKEYEASKDTYANVYINSGSIKTNEQYNSLTVTVQFTIRYDEDIDYGSIISWEGNKYRIEFMKPIERKRFWQITATRV
jgi:SPP1 family predicted phage head-tail adaptor